MVIQVQLMVSLQQPSEEGWVGRSVGRSRNMLRSLTLGSGQGVGRCCRAMGLGSSGYFFAVLPLSLTEQVVLHVWNKVRCCTGG